MRKVFGFGETVLDIIFKDGQPRAAKPGGSVLNAFVSLGRLGWDPCFVSEYGQDNVGRLIDEYLLENGVNTKYINRFTDGQSALAMAFLIPSTRIFRLSAFRTCRKILGLMTLFFSVLYMPARGRYGNLW